MDSRRHWVSWDTICNPTCLAGLGIRPLHQVMTTLHGKMAWNYLSNSSLWAIHVRSRYHIGSKGSCLWKTVSLFISSIALDRRWILGKGGTPESTFCQNLSMPFPKRFKDIPMKDGLRNPDKRRVMLHNINPRFFRSIDGGFSSGSTDTLVWEGSVDGYVITASIET